MKPWLIFDFDGTVANSIEKIRDLINELAPRYGFAQISPEKFAAMRDLPLTRAVRVTHLPFYKLGSAIAVILSEYRKIIPDLEPCAGIVPVLNEINGMGVSLALMSSNRTDNLEAWLKHNNIGCFDWVEGTGGILKKHDNILSQIRKHRMDADKVLYVGDEARDIKAARKSKVRIVSVAWGLHSAGHLQSLKPDFLVHEPQELIAIARDLLVSPNA